MAFEKNKNDMIIIFLMLIGVPLVASTNIDCSGKSFHCLNSTHFMICVDLGGGVSYTVDDFMIPCPPPTVCSANNRFECELPPSTTAAPTAAPPFTTSASEDIIIDTVSWNTGPEQHLEINIVTTQEPVIGSTVRISDGTEPGVIGIESSTVNTPEEFKLTTVSNQGNTNISIETATVPDFVLKEQNTSLDNTTTNDAPTAIPPLIPSAFTNQTQSTGEDNITIDTVSWTAGQEQRLEPNSVVTQEPAIGPTIITNDVSESRLNGIESSTMTTAGEFKITTVLNEDTANIGIESVTVPDLILKEPVTTLGKTTTTDAPTVTTPLITPAFINQKQSTEPELHSGLNSVATQEPAISSSVITNDVTESGINEFESSIVTTSGIMNTGIESASSLDLVLNTPNTFLDIINTTDAQTEAPQITTLKQIEEDVTIDNVSLTTGPEQHLKLNSVVTQEPVIGSTVITNDTSESGLNGVESSTMTMPEEFKLTSVSNQDVTDVGTESVTVSDFILKTLHTLSDDTVTSSNFVPSSINENRTENFSEVIITTTEIVTNKTNVLNIGSEMHVNAKMPLSNFEENFKVTLQEDHNISSTTPQYVYRTPNVLVQNTLLTENLLPTAGSDKLNDNSNLTNYDSFINEPSIKTTTEAYPFETEVENIKTSLNVTKVINENITSSVPALITTNSVTPTNEPVLKSAVDNNLENRSILFSKTEDSSNYFVTDQKPIEILSTEVITNATEMLLNTSEVPPTKSEQGITEVTYLPSRVSNYDQNVTTVDIRTTSTENILKLVSNSDNKEIDNQNVISSTIMTANSTDSSTDRPILKSSSFPREYFITESSNLNHNNQELDIGIDFPLTTESIKTNQKVTIDFTVAESEFTTVTEKRTSATSSVFNVNTKNIININTTNDPVIVPTTTTLITGTTNSSVTGVRKQEEKELITTENTLLAVGQGIIKDSSYVLESTPSYLEKSDVEINRTRALNDSYLSADKFVNDTNTPITDPEKLPSNIIGNATEKLLTLSATERQDPVITSPFIFMANTESTLQAEFTSRNAFDNESVNNKSGNNELNLNQTINMKNNMGGSVQNNTTEKMKLEVYAETKNDTQRQMVSAPNSKKSTDRNFPPEDEVVTQVTPSPLTEKYSLTSLLQTDKVFTGTDEIQKTTWDPSTEEYIVNNLQQNSVLQQITPSFNSGQSGQESTTSSTGMVQSSFNYEFQPTTSAFNVKSNDDGQTTLLLSTKSSTVFNVLDEQKMTTTSLDHSSNLNKTQNDVIQQTGSPKSELVIGKVNNVEAFFVTGGSGKDSLHPSTEKSIGNTIIEDSVVEQITSTLNMEQSNVITPQTTESTNIMNTLLNIDESSFMSKNNLQQTVNTGQSNNNKYLFNNRLGGSTSTPSTEKDSNVIYTMQVITERSIVTNTIPINGIKLPNGNDELRPSLTTTEQSITVNIPQNNGHEDVKLPSNIKQTNTLNNVDEPSLKIDAVQHTTVFPSTEERIGTVTIGASTTALKKKNYYNPKPLQNVETSFTMSVSKTEQSNTMSTYTLTNEVPESSSMPKNNYDQQISLSSSVPHGIDQNHNMNDIKNSAVQLTTLSPSTEESMYTNMVLNGGLEPISTNPSMKQSNTINMKPNIERITNLTKERSDHINALPNHEADTIISASHNEQSTVISSSQNYGLEQTKSLFSIHNSTQTDEDINILQNDKSTPMTPSMELHNINIVNNTSTNQQKKELTIKELITVINKTQNDTLKQLNFNQDTAPPSKYGETVIASQIKSTTNWEETTYTSKHKEDTTVSEITKIGDSEFLDNILQNSHTNKVNNGIQSTTESFLGPSRAVNATQDGNIVNDSHVKWEQGTVLIATEAGGEQNEYLSEKITHTEENLPYEITTIVTTDVNKNNDPQGVTQKTTQEEDQNHNATASKLSFAQRSEGSEKSVFIEIPTETQGYEVDLKSKMITESLFDENGANNVEGVITPTNIMTKLSGESQQFPQDSVTVAKEDKITQAEIGKQSTSGNLPNAVTTMPSLDKEPIDNGLILTSPYMSVVQTTHIPVVTEVTTQMTAPATDNTQNNSKTKLIHAKKSTTLDASGKVVNSTDKRFDCQNRFTGKYADNNDCSKFYICTGTTKLIVGRCPANTVFSEIRKQCTRNLSHCIRNNEFKCTSAGRFADFSKPNVYYICVKKQQTFLRYKLQCQKGYILNRLTATCYKNLVPASQSTSDSSQNTTEKISEEIVKKTNKSKKTKAYECEDEGKFPDPYNCRGYYICKLKDNSDETYYKKYKKCDEDEVFHKEKKKCVDATSYECRYCDSMNMNIYYVRGTRDHHSLTYKLGCQEGYYLNTKKVRCETNTKNMAKKSIQETDKLNSRKNNNNFRCQEEGKFFDPNNCRKYYLCQEKYNSERSEQKFRRKHKKCSKQEVFNAELQECVQSKDISCLN